MVFEGRRKRDRVTQEGSEENWGRGGGQKRGGEGGKGVERGAV